MRVFTLFIIIQFISVSAEPIARIGENLLESESLNLVKIDASLSHKDTSALKHQNTRALISYLENYFIERYLEDAGNQVTENEVEQEIDKLLVLTYGTSEKPSEEYGKQVKWMTEILPLLKVYSEDPKMAEKLYTEHYANSLTRPEWNQLKEGITATALEQTMRFIYSELPTDEQIREGYRGQAYAHVLNQKFLDMWGRTDLKYSDWRNERFLQVKILNSDFFEIEKLAAWFGYDVSSAKIENSEQVVTSIASVVEEIEDVVKGLAAHEPTIEESVEDVVIKPIEEDLKQSPKWWIWLIAAVALLAAFAVRHRRVNND